VKNLCWLFVALTWIPATAADKDDPGGWTNARWGMTVKQVVAAFQGSKYRLVPIRAVDGPTMDGLLAIDGCVDLQVPKMSVSEPTNCFYVWFGFTKTPPRPSRPSFTLTSSRIKRLRFGTLWLS
jgi:hypothetical protein